MPLRAQWQWTVAGAWPLREVEAARGEGASWGALGLSPARNKPEPMEVLPRTAGEVDLRQELLDIKKLLQDLSKEKNQDSGLAALKGVKGVSGGGGLGGLGGICGYQYIPWDDNCGISCGAPCALPCLRPFLKPCLKPLCLGTLAEPCGVCHPRGSDCCSCDCCKCCDCGCDCCGVKTVGCEVLPCWHCTILACPKCCEPLTATSAF